MKFKLYEAEMKVEKLLRFNYSQEIDLSIVLRQKDYLESRLPAQMRFEDEYNISTINRKNVEKSEPLVNAIDKETLEYPDQNRVVEKFVWENLTVDERIARAEKRAMIGKMDIDMEPTFTSSAFDFYGSYVRINEP